LCGPAHRVCPRKLKMDVSVIIVNWNTKDLLGDCLGSIYAQTRTSEFEVIVVDNKSSDGSAEMVTAKFPDVKLVVNDTNRGLAAAINQGFKIAVGRYVLLLNSDTLICDQAIDKTMAYAENHSDFGVVSCQVVDSDGQIMMTSFSFPSPWNLFCRLSGLASTFKNSRLFGAERMLWWDRKSDRCVDVVSGSFMLVQREAMEQVGCMDEDYFLYFEETDLCYRVAKAGWKTVFWPGAKIVHVHGGRQSSQKDSIQMFAQFHKSLLIFFKKRLGLGSYFPAKLMLTVNSGLRFLGGVIMAAMIGVLGKDTSSKQDRVHKHWLVVKCCVAGITRSRISE